MPPFLSMAFRPLFAATGLWAAAAMALWLVQLGGIWALPGDAGPVAWHAHEMIFGFVAAGIGGFALTAVANWTSRPPVGGFVLAALVLAWIAGRAAVMFAGVVGAPAAAALDALYPLSLAGLMAREIVAGRNWRNLAVPAAIAVLALCGAADLLTNGGSPMARRLAIADIAVLVSLIGGRIVPAFTRNWLAARGVAPLPARPGWRDQSALALTLVAGPAWAVFPDSVIAAALCIAAGLAHGWRLAAWRGAQTLTEPLLWILHLAYGWLVVGFALLGAGILVPDITATSGMHALTAGGFATMILAVMTRASLGHTGRALRAGLGTTSCYVILIAAVLLRVLAPFSSQGETLLALSGLAWILAWTLFVVLYLPMFVMRRVDV